MFLEAVLLGLLVGRLRGGRSVNIGNIEFKGWFLVVIAFLLQMLPMLLGRMGWMARNGHMIAFCTMLAVFGIVIWNAEKRGFRLIVLGTAANLLTMGLHGLKMPVLLPALQNAGHLELVESITNNAVLNYTGLSQLTGWSDYLGKVITLPAMYPLGQVVSVGDLVISVGIFVFVSGQMNASLYSKAKTRMVNTFYPLR